MRRLFFMTPFNPRSTGRPSRTRQWRAVELANKSSCVGSEDDSAGGSVFALALMAVVVAAALFALPL